MKRDPEVVSALLSCFATETAEFLAAAIEHVLSYRQCCEDVRAIGYHALQNSNLDVQRAYHQTLCAAGNARRALLNFVSEGGE